MTVVTPAELFPKEQIRLAEISVYNWGTFNGSFTAHVDPEGTLITGETGVGKSTLIDSLQLVLLNRHKTSFNVAAANLAKNDRSLISYIRGKHKQDDSSDTGGPSAYLRPAQTVSGIRALFKGESEFTLIVLFWLSSADMAQKDVNYQYLVADKNVLLKEVLQKFTKVDRRVLKAAFKDDPAMKFFDEFEGFRVESHKHLHFGNANAPALLVRALGLKRIDDLTNLIQNFVLDSGDVREKASQVVKGFNNVRSIHAQLIDAGERERHLHKLPELRDVLRAAALELEANQRASEAMPVYLAREWVRLLGERLTRQLPALEAKRLTKVEVDGAYASARSNETEMHALFVKAGGGTIEALQSNLATASRALQEAETHQKEYVSLASHLGFSTLLSAESFAQVQQQVRTALEQDEDNRKALEAKTDEAVIAAKLAQDDVERLQREVRSLGERRNSSVDGDYDEVRNRIADELQIGRDKLLYVAELIDVRPEEQAWRGAIERAVGDKLALAVPSDELERVLNWMNGRHLGLRLACKPVRPAAAVAAFPRGSFLNKLVWRDHPYRDWAKHLLAGKDLKCVGSPEECNATAFSMTIEGLVHYAKNDYVKDDRRRIDDQRQWCIGFTNKARLAHLRQTAEEAGAEATRRRNALGDLRAQQSAFRIRSIALQNMQKVEWADIDTEICASEVRRLGAALEAAQKPGSELEKAKRAYETARAAAEAALGAMTTAATALSSITDAVASTREALARCETTASVPVSEAGVIAAHQRAGIRVDADLDRIEAVMAQMDSVLRKEASSIQGKSASAKEEARAVMASFKSKEKWIGISADWGEGIEHIDEYVQHYEEVKTKGLHDLRERFEQHLTQHSTIDLSTLREAIKNEQEEILDRIEAINYVMRRTEFRKGTHLEIAAERQSYPLVVDFDGKVSTALNLVASNDHELRYAAIAAVIEILSKAIDPQFAGNKENLRLLDPRYRFEFVARELDENGGRVDSWSSSSGKSGGEKEAFAGTIIAASLAYVLTPDGCDRPIYSTVFLDEAFSNTSDAYSQRVLKTFRELKLHLNLITPFKNIELARSCAKLLVLVMKDRDNTSSLREVTWEYIDDTVRKRAVSAGIKVNEAA